MRRAAICFLGVLALAANAAAEELDFRLHDFDGIASLAASLRNSDFEVIDEAARLGFVVKGPTAPEHAQQPVIAQIKSRIEGIDVTAGMQADRSVIREGPAQWIGGLGVASDYELGRRSVELRTSVGQCLSRPDDAGDGRGARARRHRRPHRRRTRRPRGGAPLMLLNIATACLVIGVVLLGIRLLLRVGVRLAKVLVVVGIVMLVVATLLGMIGPLTA
jgi:hypothetical protein